MPGRAWRGDGVGDLRAARGRSSRRCRRGRGRRTRCPSTSVNRAPGAPTSTKSGNDAGPAGHPRHRYAGQQRSLGLLGESGGAGVAGRRSGDPRPRAAGRGGHGRCRARGESRGAMAGSRRPLAGSTQVAVAPGKSNRPVTATVEPRTRRGIHRAWWVAAVTMAALVAAAGFRSSTGRPARAAGGRVRVVPGDDQRRGQPEPGGLRSHGAVRRGADGAVRHPPRGGRRAGARRARLGPDAGDDRAVAAVAAVGVRGRHRAPGRWPWSSARSSPTGGSSGTAAWWSACSRPPAPPASWCSCPAIAQLADGPGWRWAAGLVVRLRAARSSRWSGRCCATVPPTSAPRRTARTPTTRGPRRRRPSTEPPARMADPDPEGAQPQPDRSGSSSASFWICGWSTNGLIGTHFIPAAHDHGMPADDEREPARPDRDLRHRRHGGQRLADRPGGQPLPALRATTSSAGCRCWCVPWLLADDVHPSLFVFIVFYGLDWVATVPPTVALCRQHFGIERAGVVFGWVFAATWSAPAWRLASPAGCAR